MNFLIHHMLSDSAARYPHKHALVHGEQRMTYREVEQSVKALGYGLKKIGVERGDRVGILLEPSIAQALSIFGVSQADAAFVPINHLLFPEQVAHIVNDCRMKALITTKSRLAALLLELAGKGSTIEGLTQRQLGERVGLVRETVVMAMASLKAKKLIGVDRRKMVLFNKKTLEELSRA